MTYTQTELVSAALADPDRAPCACMRSSARRSGFFKAPPRYRELLEADAYYRNRSDVQRKAGNGPGRSNVRLEHPHLQKAGGPEGPLPPVPALGGGDGGPGLWTGPGGAL
ncbi:MAG: hypothetical protein ACLSAF_07575 [Intestinimonas sp.]